MTFSTRGLDSGEGKGGSIILLASRETIMRSILVLEYASPGLGICEAVSVVTVVLMLVIVVTAVIAGQFGKGLPLLGVIVR